MEISVGPVEYIVIGFPGAKFSGRIIPALADLVEQGTIHIIDLSLVKKDDDGEIIIFEYDAVEELAAFAHLDGEFEGLISEADLREVGESLEPGDAAALLVWENVWATKLRDSIQDADGVLIAGGRIPDEIVDIAVAALVAAV